MAVETTFAPKLQGYRVKTDNHSVSGLSSGAFMAVQLHLAHSSHFVGAGIIAGGPYRCVETVRIAGMAGEDSNIMNAEYVCMTPLTPKTAPNVERLVALAKATPPKIDNIEHLKNQSLYIFTGTADTVVSSIVVRRTKTFYEQLGVSDIKFIDDVPAGHAIITTNPEDSPLAANKPPYINSGEFIQSHDILDQIYKGLKDPSQTLPGALLRFEQEEFAEPRFGESNLDTYGYVYVPEAVSKGAEARGVHIVLHGCKQGASFINFAAGRRDDANEAPFGNRYFTTTGYNQKAESNNLIVLYPQIKGDDGGVVQNPDGCWDWWGYSDPANPKEPDYYSKDAVQISAIHKMLMRLCSGTGTP